MSFVATCKVNYANPKKFDYFLRYKLISNKIIFNDSSFNYTGITDTYLSYNFTSNEIECDEVSIEFCVKNGVLDGTCETIIVKSN